MNSIYSNIFRWIIDGGRVATHDFCQSGMPELALDSVGIEISYEDFKKWKGIVEKDFTDQVAMLYNVDSEQVITTAGGTEGIALASIYLHRNSQCIDIAVPEYEPLYRMPETMGFRTKRINSYEERTAEKNHSLSTTFPNNPTGDMEGDRKLSSYFENGNLTYIDETFREFLFPEKPYTFLHSYPDALTSVTMTKFYGAGQWRIGWIMGSREKMREIREYRFLTTGSTNKFSLYTGMKILEKRKEIQENVKKVLSENRKNVKDYMNRLHLKFTSPEHTTFTFVQTNRESLRVAENMLDKYGIFVSPGEYFGVPGGYRLCMTQEPSRFKSDLDALVKYYEEQGESGLI